MTAARAGYTLVELMIGLVFTLAVSGVIHQVLLANRRMSRTQAEYAGMQDNVRTGALIVASELRELGFDSVPGLAGLGAGPAASSDILVAQPGRIRYRAMRGLGFTCSAPTTAVVLLRGAGYQGLRQPAANVDSVSIFVEGDPALADDDAWVRARVTGVSAGACADGATGIALSTAWDDAAVGAAAVTKMVVGGPVRVFEIMELQYYPQDGRSWLGMRSVSRSEVIQPLVGPLADSTANRRGFTLGYLDRGGNPAAVSTEVRTITIALQGVTAQPVRSVNPHHPTVDSLALTSRVALRNMLRP